MVDGVDDAVADPLGGHQKSTIAFLGRHARQVVEESGDIVGDDRIAGEQAEVLVLTGRLGVVVAGPDVGVATQPVPLVANDH